MAGSPAPPPSPIAAPPDPPSASDVAPEISVVVPARDAAPLLARCLGALAASQGVRWECIVVDDGSRDDPAAVARAFEAQPERQR